MWTWLGSNKNQITILSALIASVFVLFQYLGYQRNVRISRAIDYVRELRGDRNLNARIYVAQIWMEEMNRKVRADFNEFDEGLLRHAADLINKDESYRHHFHVLHAFYVESALCTASYLCDRLTMCRAFYRVVYEFRHLHVTYLKSWAEVTKEDEIYYLDMLITVCDSPDNHFALENEALSCQVWVYFKGLLNLDNRTFCRDRRRPPSDGVDYNFVMF
jgi:hypothetical protein